MEMMQIVLMLAVIALHRITGNNPFFTPSLLLIEYNTRLNGTIISKFYPHNRTNIDITLFTGRKFTVLSVFQRGQTCVVFDPQRKSLCTARYDADNWYQPSCVDTFGKVNDIAIDESRGMAYWSDADFNAIVMAPVVNLRRRTVITDTSLDIPDGVVVHPQEGLLFWTDVGSEPKIERSTLLGRHRQTIIREGTPLLLTLDRSRNRLYWINNNTNTLESTDLLGEEHRAMDIDLSGIVSPVWNSMVIFESHLLISLMGHNNADLLSIELVLDGETVRLPPLPSHQSVCSIQEQPQLESIALGNSSASEEYGIENSVHGSILFTTSNGMYKMDAYSLTSAGHSSATLIVSENLTVFTSDPTHQKIFAYHRGRRSIVTITEPPEDGYWRLQDIVMVAADVKYMVVDWISRNLIWVEEGSENIYVSNYSGYHRTWLISEVRADELAIDPDKKRIFWINGTPGFIEGADLDGEYRTFICCSNTQIYSFTIDTISERLIAFDIQSGYLISLDYFGRTDLRINQRGFLNVGFLSKVKDYVVVVGNNAGTVTPVHIRTGDRQQTKTVTDKEIIHLQLYHLMPATIGRCAVNNGGCHQLCLPNRIDRKCACGFGYEHDTETNKCISNLEDTTFFLIVDQRAPAIYQYYNDRSLPELLRYKRVDAIGLKQPYAIAYDNIQKMIYWSDIEHHSVSRISISGHYQEIVIGEENLYALDIVMCNSLRLLFVADYSRSRILALNVITLQITTLVEDINLVYGLAMDLSNRYLYATGYGAFPSFVRIDLGRRSKHTDGLPTLLYPGHLLVHRSTIYVIDHYEGRIIRIGTSGAVHTFITLPLGHHVRFMTSERDYLYWTETKTRMIYKANINTLEISTFGLEGIVMHPVGLVYHGYHVSAEILCDLPCQGRCVPSGVNSTTCLRFTEPRNVSLPRADICTVPSNADITYGQIDLLRPGAKVPGGTRIYVKCFPVHNLVSNRTGYCRNRIWTHIPECEPVNKIYGTRNGGWTIFTRSGEFYVYSWMEIVHVIVIGGGGGGYENNMERTGAGSGQRSTFWTNHSLSIMADGGTGGTANSAGIGGFGEQRSGLNGSLESYGGSIWNLVPNKVQSLFCANDFGPFSHFTRHPQNRTTNIRIRRDCRSSNSCRHFGDGAESIHGGSGGSGGYSQSTRRFSPGDRNKLIRIDVGSGGDPSYSPAGGGVVIIWWGWDADLYDVDATDIDTICTQSLGP